MSGGLVLFGAGAAGRYALRHLQKKGILPCCFADNDDTLWNEYVEINGWEQRGGQSHVPIHSPSEARRMFPDAEWVACAISRPAATEIRSQMRNMGVRTKPLWECIPVCHGVPPLVIQAELDWLCADEESADILKDQWNFRESPDYDVQMAPAPIGELYFPQFITRREDEHFVDCGAADGDTIRSFMEKWPQFSSITAFEPDPANYTDACMKISDSRVTIVRAAVSDNAGTLQFIAAGDYSSHFADYTSRDDKGGKIEVVRTAKLDDFLGTPNDTPPTYIKMDIEGAELEALWGARKILRDHAPVLAICAYHTSDHIWQIPLLIHAMNPEYKLYFRRYGEGAFELVWYGVPPERIAFARCNPEVNP
jgi:FkbM family methyltransferase